MKKYEFALTDELYAQALAPIRKKREIIKLFINTLELMLITDANPDVHLEKDKKVVLYVDKMSRLFFCLKGKIFSIHFPVKVQEDDVEKRHLHIMLGDSVEINSVILSLLLSLINQEDFWDTSWSDMENRIIEEILEYEQEDYLNEKVIGDFIRKLMLFEPGYLRYDHDPDHMNGTMHPEYHLHFFYDSSNMIRLGLQSAIDADWLLDAANVKTECKYVTK